MATSSMTSWRTASEGGRWASLAWTFSAMSRTVSRWRWNMASNASVMPRCRLVEKVHGVPVSKKTSTGVNMGNDLQTLIEVISWFEKCCVASLRASMTGTLCTGKGTRSLTIGYLQKSSSA